MQEFLEILIYISYRINSRLLKESLQSGKETLWRLI